MRHPIFGIRATPIGGYRVAWLKLLQQQPDLWTVHTGNQRTTWHDALCELSIGLPHLVQRAKAIRVIHLDHGDHGDLWLKTMEHTPIFVSLDHKPLARAGRGIGAQILQHTSNDKTRVQSGSPQDHGNHAGSGRLAMRASHSNHPFAGEQGPQELSTLQNGNAPLMRGDDLRIGGRNGRRHDDQLSVCHGIRRVANRDMRPFTLKGLGNGRWA